LLWAAAVVAVIIKVVQAVRALLFLTQAFP
jgi:hypothetical protein